MNVASRQKRPFTARCRVFMVSNKRKRLYGQYTAWPLRDCLSGPSRDSVSGAHSVRVEVPVQGAMDLPTVQTNEHASPRFKQRLWQPSGVMP